MDTHYNAYPVAANATQAVTGTRIGGFLCTTAGNFKLALNADGSGADIVANVAATAGQFLRIPYAPGAACAVVLSGGAAGTLFAV